MLFLARCFFPLCYKSSTAVRSFASVGAWVRSHARIVLSTIAELPSVPMASSFFVYRCIRVFFLRTIFCTMLQGPAASSVHFGAVLFPLYLCASFCLFLFSPLAWLLHSALSSLLIESIRVMGRFHASNRNGRPGAPSTLDGSM